MSVYGTSFDDCLSNLDRVLQRCEDTSLVLNLEKCHFMVNESIVLGHKISERGIEVDQAKVDAIEKCHVLKISKVFIVSLVMLVSIGGLSNTFLQFLGLLLIF